MNLIKILNVLESYLKKVFSVGDLISYNYIDTQGNKQKQTEDKNFQLQGKQKLMKEIESNQSTLHSLATYSVATNINTTTQSN